MNKVAQLALAGLVTIAGDSAQGVTIFRMAEFFAGTSFAGDSLSGSAWSGMNSFLDHHELGTWGARAGGAGGYLVDFAQLTGSDPLNHGHVLNLWVRDDAPNRRGIARSEYSFFYDQTGANAFHDEQVRYDMYIPEYFGDMFNRNDELDWMIISELKEIRGGGPGTPYNYRITLQIRKDAGGALYWYLKGEQIYPVRVHEWSLENHTIPVPMGEWFRLQQRVRKSTNDGLIVIKLNGENIFYRNGRTEHATAPLPIEYWSTMKVYTSDANYDKYRKFTGGEAMNFSYDVLRYWSK